MAPPLKGGKLAARSIDTFRYKFIQGVVAALLCDERAGAIGDEIRIIARSSDQDIKAEAILAATC